MSVLKILIIEDDLLLGEELEEQLLEFGYSITDRVTNSEDALLAFRRRLPDLVLCDINLEGSKKDGIEIAKMFNNLTRVPIIFLTAFGDEGTVHRAKAVQPAYYLLKPCNSTQLQIALDFALANFTKNQEAHPAHSLQHHTSPSCPFYSASNFFFVKDGYKYVRIEVSDIAWVEALGSNVKIITDDFKTVLAANLSSFSKQLPHHSLMRVHRSYIINLHKVIAYDGGRAFIRFQDGQMEIPVGRSFRDNLRDRLPRLKAD